MEFDLDLEDLLTPEAEQFKALPFNDKLIQWSIKDDSLEIFTIILAGDIRARYTNIEEYDEAKKPLTEIFIMALSGRDQAIWKASNAILGQSAKTQEQMKLKKLREQLRNKITAKHATLGRRAFTASAWNAYQDLKLKVIF
jgi:hypothetical protein